MYRTGGENIETLFGRRDCLHTHVLYIPIGYTQENPVYFLTLKSILKNLPVRNTKSL